VRLIGGKSGFKTFRDLAFFVAGLTICFYHIFTTPAKDLSLKLLVFGGSIAGAPVAFRQDEKKE